MGNQNTGPHKGPDAVSIQKEDDLSTNSSAGRVSRDRPPGPSAELLNSLQSLGEHSDYTLLPQSLHQIAEAYSLKEDYQWAVHFLQLEKLYHERLLSNLSALQEDWESQWKEKKATESSVTNSIDEEHIKVLGQICRTHHRPSLRTEKSISDTMLTDIQSIVRQRDMNEMVPPQHDHVNDAQMAHRHEDEEDEEDEQQSMTTESKTSSQHRERAGGSEESQPEEDEEEAYEEGLEAEEEEEEEEEGDDGEVLGEATPEEEQVKVEWPAGVPQASVKDLVKLSHKDGSSSPDGLVSILKRRRASLDGLPPSGPAATKSPSKRKVRFIEPEDAMEHDEVGGDSCLILLLLCLVTVVISIGGTALYCTLVDTYSNICTDFSHNVDFYVMNLRRFLDELRRWLPLWT